MKYIMKRIHFIFMLFCILAAVFSISLTSVHADVGNSHSGGSSQRSNTSNNSSSNNSSSSNSGSKTYYHSSSSSNTRYSGSNTFIAFLPFFIFFGAIVVSFISKSNKKNSQASVSKSPELSEDQVLQKIKAVDPSFSEEDFKIYVKECYMILQDAWEKKNWRVTRPIETNLLFQTHSRQLQEYIDYKRTNYLQRQNIRNVTLADFRQTEKTDILTVKLYASLIDYIEDDETKQLIEGSRTEHQHRYYRLVFLRKRGSQNNGNKKFDGSYCPNCGAPIDLNIEGECEYCHTVVTSGEFGWLLNVYEAW